MSDLLRTLWKSIEDGWKGGAALALPTPSVGRGLFSDPFLSERDRDLIEVRALYARVRAAHAAVGWTDETLEDALLQVFKEAMKASGATDPDTAVAMAYWPLKRLLEDELLALPHLDETDWGRLSLATMSELRSQLLRKDLQLAHADESFDLACRAGTALLTRVLEASTDTPKASDRGVLTLDAAVLDILHDPEAQIEFAWSLPFAKELQEARLLEDVRLQLEQNALAACRVDPADPRAWTSKVYLPTDARAKGRTPREMAAEYLDNTPLAELFGAQVPLAISQEVRFEHTHILGGSGHGKTQLLLHLIHHDLTSEEGPGLIVIDSQGDLVRTLSRLERFHPDGPLADRLVIVDPADIEYPVALSLFATPERHATYGGAERERLLNGAIEMYEYVFSSLLGAELTQKQGVIFRFLARLMLAIPGSTLHTFLDLMEHGERFRSYMQQLDGTARRFFDDEFFHPSFAATKKQIAKRLWGILANPVFERMFSRPASKLDLFEAMQARKIILISTAKDVLRQEGAELLGRFFLAKITQAVMERATLPAEERAPCLLYIDEAHEYVDEQMALLLNQARKYRLGLTLAHQNLDQLPPTLRASVMSSTSIKFAGGVSAKDARALADEMHVDADFLQRMRKRRGHTEFACHIRNRLPRALSVSIPLGAVNALPRLEDDDFGRLVDRNRRSFCTVTRDLARHQPAHESVPAVTSLSTSTPEARTRSAPNQTDVRIQGRGGAEHTYLQHLLRTAANECGLMAEVEHQVAGGAVDLAIQAGGRRVACEISVTTDAEHEAQNAAKCLAAGFEEVWIVVASSRRKAARAKAMAAKLDAAQAPNVKVVTVSEALDEIAQLSSVPSVEAKQVRGYSVTVRSASISPEEALRRREAIASILAKSIRAAKE